MIELIEIADFVLVSTVSILKVLWGSILSEMFIHPLSEAVSMILCTIIFMIEIFIVWNPY